MNRWSVLVVLSWLFLAAGCSNPLAGRYAGQLTVTQGLCSSEAPTGAVEPATLMLHGTEALFTPGDGVVVLNGHVDASGHVDVSTGRTGSGHDQFTQVFEGQVKNGRATGQYASPRCRADVTLQRRP